MRGKYLLFAFAVTMTALIATVPLQASALAATPVSPRAATRSAVVAHPAVHSLAAYSEADPSEIIQLSEYHTTYVYGDDTWLDGFVQGDATSAVGAVFVEIVYSDGHGGHVSVDQPADCWVIARDGSGSFSALLDPTAGSFESVTVWGFRDSPDELPLMLSISADQTWADDYDYTRTYTGVVTNNTALDVTGTIVSGVEWGYPEHTPSALFDCLFAYDGFELHLMPGESFAYEAYGVHTNGTQFYLSPELHAEAVELPAGPGLTVFELDSVVSARTGGRITGRVLDDAAQPVAATLVHYRTSTDRKTWTPSALVATRADGRFVMQVLPPRTTYYRFEYTDGASVVTSATARVRPTAVVSAPKCPPDVNAGARFTVTGTIKPGQQAGSGRVAIECYASTEDGWVLDHTVTAKVTRSKGVTRYSAALSLKSGGPWQLVATAPGDATHGPGSSDPSTLEVGRTKLSIKTNRTSVAYKQKFTVSGTLRTVKGRAAAKQRVVLQLWDPYFEEWTDVATVVTSRTGAMSKTLTLQPRTCRFRFLFDGSAAYESGVSGAKTVRPHKINFNYPKLKGQMGAGIGASVYRYGPQRAFVIDTGDTESITVQVMVSLRGHTYSDYTKHYNGGDIVQIPIPRGRDLNIDVEPLPSDAVWSMFVW